MSENGGEPLPVHPQGETAAYNGKLKTGKNSNLLYFYVNHCKSTGKAAPRFFYVVDILVNLDLQGEEILVARSY